MNGRTNTTSVTEVVEGVQVALEAPTNLVLTPLNARVDLTWTDPVDKYAAPDGQTATNPWDNVATWDHSIVVRKAGSAPTSPDDGELIYTETTRNQHQYTAYSDTDNVINNTVYYYAIYAITTMDAISDPIIDSCKPIEGTPEFDKLIGTLNGNYRSANPGAIGDYALFAGGDYGNPTTSYTGAVDTFNISLTQGSATSLPNQTDTSITSTARTDYVLFCGGAISRYSSSVTATNTVIAYDTSLTQSTATQLSSNAKFVGAATLNNVSFVAGGSSATGNQRNAVEVYDESLTKSSAQNMPSALYKVSGDKIGTHVVFGGGLHNQYYSYVSHMTTYSQVIAYDQSRTLSSLTSLSVPRNTCGCAALDNCIVFAGGSYNGEGGYTEGIHCEVDAYDTSLTKLPDVTSLPGGNVAVFTTYPNSAVRCGSYIVVKYGTGMSDDGFVQYDSSLTQSRVKNTENIPSDVLTTSRFTSIGDYALIPGYGRSTQVIAIKAV